MKHTYFIFLLFIIISSCNNPKQIVDANYVDNTTKNDSFSNALKQQNYEVNFWYNRINSKDIDVVSYSKYANSLIAHFNLLGNINDILKADSLYNLLNKHFNNTETSYKITLIYNGIKQHKFIYADSILKQINAQSLSAYEKAATTFDVNFELGNYLLAQNELKKIKNYNDFNFLFRSSKLNHYNSNIDSAIANMQLAAIKAGENKVLKQTALSNLGDLYLHNNKLNEAYTTFKQSIFINNTDLHSLTGIGTIALLHDKNDSLAEKIFLFVHKNSQKPDALFKLMQVYMKRKDSVMAKKIATDFVKITTNKSYGNMYNKYLIQIFTTVLPNPVTAENIALKELQQRKTPQSYAWYVWCLSLNNKINEAAEIYNKYVTGKPLEGLELYWMGKYMQTIKKGYNAKQYFEKAYKNKYDLTPDIIDDIETNLD